MSPFISEFLGTTTLVLLGDGVVANVVLNKTKGQNSGWIVITAAWAFAVFCGVIVAQPSGAHLNPAVTLSLAVAGKFAWANVFSYVAAQILGAMCGALIVWIMYKPHFDASADNPGGQLAVFATGPAILNYPANLLSEIIGTFVLIFVILFFGTEKNVAGLAALGPLPVAILVFAIGLSLGGTTGYAINPARDLGPRIIHAIVPIKGKGTSDWSYAWVPIVGPSIGAVLAAVLFNLL
jgi:glycerol uptake facilitator protein